MIKLTILDIDNYVFSLGSDNNARYSLNLEFININNRLSINDIIYIDEKLLTEKGFYTFGPFNSIYGKNIKMENDEDIAILETKNKRIYLQRYYG